MRWFLLLVVLLLVGCAAPPRLILAVVHLDLTIAPFTFLAGLLGALDELN